MLFHVFHSQAERRAFGGSDFIEIQHCKLAPDTEIEKIVSGKSIENWKNDSLYIFGDDWDVFYARYGEIFQGGTYANLETGPLDWCGIQYYSAEQREWIIKQIQVKRPLEYQTFLHWLEIDRPHNGFYVLGV